MPILIALFAFAGAILAAGGAMLLAILEAACKTPPPRKTTRRRRRTSNKMHYREISPEEFEELMRETLKGSHP